MMTAILIFCVLNLIVLFFIGLHLIQFKERVIGILSDLIDFQEKELPASPLSLEKNEPKTWDEKYEKELEVLYNRIRSNSGLKEVPVGWGSSEDKPEK